MEVREDDAFVDAGHQRHSESAISSAGDEGNGLTGVAENVGRLGVALTLEEFFNPWHFASGLRDFDSVGQQNQPALGMKDRREMTQCDANPEAGEFLGVEGWAVEEVQQPVVATWTQAQDANDAGNASHVLPGTQPSQDGGHPQKRLPSGTGIT